MGLIYIYSTKIFCKHGPLLACYDITVNKKPLINIILTLNELHEKRSLVIPKKPEKYPQA